MERDRLRHHGGSDKAKTTTETPIRIHPQIKSVARPRIFESFGEGELNPNLVLLTMIGSTVNDRVDASQSKSPVRV